VSAPIVCCKILVPYRQVRRRRVAAWTRLCPAGALAIGGFGRSRWRLRRTRAGHIIINGYSMAVSPFDRLRSGRTRIDKQVMCSTASTIITQKPTVASEKIAARRTRDSVRRASDFVQIAITLVDQLSGLECLYALGTAIFRESRRWSVGDCAVAGLTARVARYIRQVTTGIFWELPQTGRSVWTLFRFSDDG
jgi:hypothetical protein